MYIGMRESEARALVTKAMTVAGLQNAGALTLFGGDSQPILEECNGS